MCTIVRTSRDKKEVTVKVPVTKTLFGCCLKSLTGSSIAQFFDTICLFLRGILTENGTILPVYDRRS